MKKFFFFFPILLVSCSGNENFQHEQYKANHEKMVIDTNEKKLMDCWSTALVNKGDSSTQIQLEGVQLLEKYLLEKKYLKGTEASNYTDFLNDPQQVVIPESIDNFKTIELAFEGDSRRKDVSIEDLGICFENNIPDKKDSTDALFRMADIFIRLKNEGAYSVYPFFEFYQTLSTKDFNRPFIKTMFYMNLMNIKVSLRKRYEPITIDLPDNR